MNPLGAHRRRRAGSAVLAGLLIGGVVAAVLLTRAPIYRAETSVIARPVSDILGPAATQFGEVVSLGLPALPELASSPTVLQDVSDAVPGAPDVDALADDIDVALLPGTGVARITVRADDPDLAAALADGVVDRLIAADVLEPAARLERLDEAPRVGRSGPSVSSAVGIGLAVALAVGGAVLAGLRRVRPRGTDVRGVHAALERAGQPPVAVLDGRDPVLAERIAALQQVRRHPLRVLAVGPGRTDRVDELRTLLGERGVELVDPGEPGGPGADAAGNDAATRAGSASVIAVLEARRTAPDELAAAVAALPDRSAMLAVILT